MNSKSVYAAGRTDRASHADDPAPSKPVRQPATTPQVEDDRDKEQNSSSLASSKGALIEKGDLPRNGDCQQGWCHEDTLTRDTQPKLLEDMLGSSNVGYVDGWLTRRSNAAFCQLNAEAARRWKRPTSKRRDAWKNVVTLLARKIKSFAGLVRLKRTCVTSGGTSLMHTHERDDSQGTRSWITLRNANADDALPPFHKAHLDARSPLQPRSMSSANRSANIKNIEGKYKFVVPEFSEKEALVMSREMERLRQSRGGKFTGPRKHFRLPPRDDYAQTLAAASYVALHALTSKSTVRSDVEAEVVLDHRFVLRQFGGRWPSTQHVHLAKNVAARTRAKVSKRRGRKCVAWELAHARNAHRTGHSRRWSPGNNAV